MSFAELFLLGIPAVLLTGISKGGFGGALGGIAVPLLALMMPPTQAAAIMLPILCMADITGLRRFYGKWDLHNLKIMLPGALLGVLAGTLSFGLLSERLLGLMIGGIAIVFFLLNVLNAAATQSQAGALCVARAVHHHQPDCQPGPGANRGGWRVAGHLAAGPRQPHLVLPHRLGRTIGDGHPVARAELVDGVLAQG
jgi:uncharacterized membrane protein YfcA